MSEAAPAVSVPSKRQPDPLTQPVEYLLVRGWRPDGDARDPRTRWLDPTKPDRDREERRVVGERKLPSGATETITQVFVTPAAWPMPREEAVLVEMARKDR